MPKKVAKTTVRKGARVVNGKATVVTTKPARGLGARLLDKALKAAGK